MGPEVKKLRFVTGTSGRFVTETSGHFVMGTSGPLALSGRPYCPHIKPTMPRLNQKLKKDLSSLLLRLGAMYYDIGCRYEGLVK